MTALSNTYVEKVISEHPVAVWMLNEQVDYLSSITETERQFYNTGQWTISNGTVVLKSSPRQDTPFPDSVSSFISGNDVTPPATNTISLTSVSPVPTNTFYQDYANFAMSFYLYIDNPYTTQVKFGYRYYDPITMLTEEVFSSKTISESDQSSWMFFGDTFELLPSGAINSELFIDITTTGNGNAGDYKFDINGLTIGQWSEEFYRTSLGVNPVALPSDIALPIDPLAGSPTCVPARPYGASTLNGYYLSHDYRLYANNFGIPLVYGSSNVTRLFPHIHGETAYPNLIFPGYGFFNEKGKYNDYTVEMWIRINTDANDARKLFGPLNSPDGLYVEGGFLTLVINNKFQSHYVGEWFRPMLIHIRYIRSNISMLVNGEQVVSIDINDSDINFPSEFDNSNKNQDWLGFYAYEDIKPLEIDSFAIYSYSVPNEVAKRRWVWGQGVAAPETTNSLLNATTAFNDYSFTNYAVNYNYPDFASWRQAFFSNIETSSNFLQLPNYSLPEIYLDNYKSKQEWYDDNENITLPTYTRTNIMTNPSIETSTTGWGENGGQSISRSSTYKHSGAYSLKSVTNLGYSSNIKTGYINATAGLAYTASLYALSPNSTSSAFVRLRWFNASNVQIGENFSSASALSTSWQRYSVTATAPANTAKAEIWLSTPNPTTSTTMEVYLDSVLLEQSSTLGSYFDGGYTTVESKYEPVTSWTGTAQLSTSTLTALSDEDDANNLLFYTFRPNTGWNSKNCYLYFSKFGVLNDPVETVYGVFKTDGTAVNEPLFKIKNKITNDYIWAKVNGTTLTYIVNISGNNTTIATKTIAANQKFTAGLNIANVSSISVNEINKLFADQSIMEIYVGGDATTTFTGRIYQIGFDAAYNNRKINTLYDTGGIFNHNLATANIMTDHVANYTLKAIAQYSTYFLDIAVAGYWEDYMPLSYFSKKVVDYQGEEHYDLDTIQLNLDYPEPLEVSALESVSSWTYQDLNNRYSDPSQLDYSILDNNFYSGWDDYQDMSEDSNKYYYYTTSTNGVRSYISFQKIKDGANKNLVDFDYKATARLLGVVDPDTLVEVDGGGSVLPTKWENTAYEVVDGTVIYPPKVDENNKAVDFNDLAIVYHLEFQTEGILHHPVTFRELQLASQVLERSKFTPMGTRFGTPVFPYSQSGVYYNYKGANPISTYKGSTPYLYLNRHSGWRLRGRFSPFVDRGISILVNPQEGLDVEVSAIQMWLRYADIVLPTEETPIFSIQHYVDGESVYYDFYIKSDESTQRGYITARNRDTNAIIENIKYYINGKLVDKAYIVNEQWSVLSISFPDLLQYDGNSGVINLNGPMTYNNVSYYLATNLEQNQKVEIRSWGEVKDDSIAGKLVNDGGSPITIYGWELWKYKDSINPPSYLTWQNVGIVSTTDIYSIDPSLIYDKYVGTSRIVVDDEVDGVMVDPDNIKIYGDIIWNTTTTIPV